MDEKERKRAEGLGFKFVEGKEPGRPFWPEHVLEQVIAVYIMIAIVFTLAILAPWPLHAKADPLSTPHAIKPEWYFLSSYQLLKYMPKWLGMMISGLGFAALVAWPFLDRGKEKSARRRPLALLVGTCGFTLVLALTVLGHISENTYDWGDGKIHFDAKGVPHAVEQENGKYYYVNSKGEKILVSVKKEEAENEE